MDQQTFESACAYVGFTESTSEVLRSLHPALAPFFVPIVDDFYATIEAHAEARAAITGGTEQVLRLKRTLVAWLDSAFRGPHDLTYLEARSRIGRVHVRISLPQHLMFTAMNRIRTHLVIAVAQHAGDDRARCEAGVTAVNQVLDLDLAIMLSAYREDMTVKMRAAERLSTIGQLAASIGHELRNPLGIVESSLYLMKQHMEALGLDDEKLVRHRDKIHRQVKQCERTITDLLELARDKPPARREFDVKDAVASITESLSPGPRVQIISAVGDVRVHADPNQLFVVLSNLVANALHALGESGTVRIGAQAVRGGTEITVRDDGPGVPPELSSRIFDALVTTKAKGTGLGLALCRRIVVGHGGEIDLLPTDRGACFRVWLPDSPGTPRMTGDDVPA